MPAQGKRRGKPATHLQPPLRFNEDPLLWASWLYYEEGLTQNEIALQIGASRPTVNAYLAEARSKGIVDISISTEMLRSTTLSGALTERFGLDDCLIVPNDGGDRSLIERLGVAAAQALPRFLFSGDTIAVTWGRTMLAVAEHAKHIDGIDMTVVQATGSTTAAIAYTPDACATRLADHIGARFVPISAPAIVSSKAVRLALLSEPVIKEQLQTLDRVNRVLFGVSSLHPNSTIHSSGFLDGDLSQLAALSSAVGSLAGRFIDMNGDVVDAPLQDRTIGLDLEKLRRIPTRILVAGGLDKVPPMLAAMRGKFASVLITDASTAEGILRADGAELANFSTRPAQRQKPEGFTRSKTKKFINHANRIVDEAIEGALAAFPDTIEQIGESPRAIRAIAEKPQGKVGIVIGGGAGHEPSFLGFVGKGLADAVAIGNIFASPPPVRILECARDVDRGAGVVFIFGNYSGDVMNFEMAADLAKLEDIKTRSVLTTDDVASADSGDRSSRRGTAGNIFIFKVAGAASARLYSLDECVRLARKANEACYTIGVALEPNAIPDTLVPSFKLGENEFEFGVGVHGEPGVRRQPMTTADRIVDQICDQLFSEMNLGPGTRVAVLINSLGGTPMMELFVLNRRLTQRLQTRGAIVHKTLVGHYCTSLDMVGASITLMVLDEELRFLLDDPCDAFSYAL